MQGLPKTEWKILKKKRVIEHQNEDYKGAVDV